MNLILDSRQMQACDKNTIEKHQVPSLVLMERAALSVTNSIKNHFPMAGNITVLCGPGNNGGDGVAIGRQLALNDIHVILVLLGNPDKFSEQLKSEINIAKSYDIDMIYGLDKEAIAETDLFVDAMFGIGLTRGLSGEFLETASYINNSGKNIVAVDIPSGYSADSGQLLGEDGVKADYTVTFAYMKKGLILGDCKEATGNIEVADVGIYLDSISEEAMLLDDDILLNVPKRSKLANKGTCGKLLIIAGSESMYGACYLAAKAALVTGSGLVKIYTHENNRESIQQSLPEAMYVCYKNFNKEELITQIKWADAIVIGPGLGTGELSAQILNTTMENINVPTVVDADGINLLSRDISLLMRASSRCQVILTPHLKEMERICETKVGVMIYNMEVVAHDFVRSTGCTLVLKNHTTVIAGEKTYYCNSGNEALATPGSGDVLAGIIGSLLGQGCSPELAAAAGAYIHGQAGTMASKTCGIKGVLASDIISHINQIDK